MKLLRHKETGVVYRWTEVLAKLSIMEEYDAEPAKPAPKKKAAKRKPKAKPKAEPVAEVVEKAPEVDGDGLEFLDGLPD